MKARPRPAPAGLRYGSTALGMTKPAPELRRYPQFAIGRDPDVAQLNFAQRQGH